MSIVSKITSAHSTSRTTASRTKANHCEPFLVMSKRPDYKLALYLNSSYLRYHKCATTPLAKVLHTKHNRCYSHPRAWYRLIWTQCSKKCSYRWKGCRISDASREESPSNCSLLDHLHPMALSVIRDRHPPSFQPLLSCHVGSLVLWAASLQSR